MTLFAYLIISIAVITGLYYLLECILRSAITHQIHKLDIVSYCENDTEIILRRLLRLYPYAVIHVRCNNSTYPIALRLATENSRIIPVDEYD